VILSRAIFATAKIAAATKMMNLNMSRFVVMKEGCEKQIPESQKDKAVTRRGKVQQRDLMLYRTTEIGDKMIVLDPMSV
jgi:hypothetical protein